MGKQNKELIENINKLNKMRKITQEQFEAYEDVRVSGITNMFDVKTVGQLSGLEREEIMEIMKNYGTLNDKYNE
tara:strand:+ start:138 stop:359 length:222 start_codon:yes stop_codon:yes gene_type:complete